MAHSEMGVDIVPAAGIEAKVAGSVVVGPLEVRTEIDGPAAAEQMAADRRRDT
jgi:hypothetical protein